ncbi:class I SAM-dependent methyltransferase [Alginatibacterium sediminis]|uniref:Class I SAM-dependent methyltransferase n=1 Tax=Alginatibacterium sediminis TaxID=2164068 RepID=A0A420EB86_9ALTE|nr:class I SAM-dependent methyltransferase [Alginatibacterium sediminis]RKF17913.1 class I SAM-dependent methyltransferase [Alginatibacterium sediminis]
MWDKEYDRQEYVYGKLPNDFLKSHYASIPKGKVLLLAEGEGRNAVFLAKLGYSVTAVDFSSVGLKKAEKLAKENKVEIETICANLDVFDLGEHKWDGIVSIYCHLPPSLRQNLYKRIERALKPSGVFLLEGYRPEQLAYKTGGPAHASMMSSKDSLVKELPKISFSYLESLDREVNEGINHHGMGAVIQAIGTLK